MTEIDSKTIEMIFGKKRRASGLDTTRYLEEFFFILDLWKALICMICYQFVKLYEIKARSLRTCGIKVIIFSQNMQNELEKYIL